MSNTTKIIMVMVFFSLLSSCGKKVYLSEEELEAVNVYNVGDKLIFQNIITKDKDTSTIVKKEIYHPNYDWFRHDGYQPQIAEVRYQNKALKYDRNQEGGLLGRKKMKPEDQINYSLSYLYTIFFTEDSDLKLNSITLDSISKTFNEVYIFDKGTPNKHFKKDKHGWKPKKLYWDKKYGIIKYITFEGEIWERINWDNE